MTSSSTHPCPLPAHVPTGSSPRTSRAVSIWTQNLTLCAHGWVFILGWLPTGPPIRTYMHPAHTLILNHFFFSPFSPSYALLYLYARSPSNNTPITVPFKYLLHSGLGVSYDNLTQTTRTGRRRWGKGNGQTLRLKQLEQWPCGRGRNMATWPTKFVGRSLHSQLVS